MSNRAAASPGLQLIDYRHPISPDMLLCHEPSSLALASLERVEPQCSWRSFVPELGLDSTAGGAQTRGQSDPTPLRQAIQIRCRQPAP